MSGSPRGTRRPRYWLRLSYVVCDATVITTPDKLQIDFVTKLANADLHVIIENPTTVSFNDLARPESLVDEIEVTAQVDYRGASILRYTS